MTFGEGAELERLWQDLDETQKSTIASQLSEHMRVLRAVPPPVPNLFCSIAGGLLPDFIFEKSPQQSPFQRLQEWNAALTAIQRKSAPWEHLSHLIEHALAQIKHGQSALTYADLQSRNIMVLGDKVTDIIDWESYGWYPE